MNIHVETPRPSARSLSLPKMVTAALIRPDITCFPGPEPRKFTGLSLIRVCLARARAGALSRRGARATRAASDEARPLMALGKFVIPKRPRKQPSRKTQGAPPGSCPASQRNLLSGRRTPLAEGGDDVLGEQLHLAHLLFPRHRALVEEPREPFEVAVAADAPQRLDLGFDLIDRPGERVFGLAHSLDGPLGGRQHLVGRVFGGILGHAKRLPEPEAAEVIVKAGIVGVAQQRHRLLFGAAEMDGANHPDAFPELQLAAGPGRHLLVHAAQTLEVGWV